MTYLPEGYKLRKHRVVEGVAESGEVSPKGTVSHIEDWEGRVAAEAAPASQRYEYSISTGKLRRLTFEELVDRGYFIIAKGPVNAKHRS